MSLADLSSTVLALSSGDYVVTRAAGPKTYTQGKAVAPTTSPSTLTVTASVQPLTGRELQRLPEGMRTKELMKMYLVEELLVSAPGQEPDTVSIDGVDFQVEAVERWGPLGNYHKAIVSKVP